MNCARAKPETAARRYHLGGLLGIRGTSATALVKVSEVSLGEWITSICGLAIPAHGFVEVLVHAFPELKRQPHPELRVRISFKSLLT